VLINGEKFVFRSSRSEVRVSIGCQLNGDPLLNSHCGSLVVESQRVVDPIKWRKSGVMTER